MSNAGQILGEIAFRVVAIAIEGAVKSAIASSVSMAPVLEGETVLVQFPAAIEIDADDDARIGRECATDEAVVAHALNFLGARKIHAHEMRNAASANSASVLRFAIVDMQSRTEGARSARRWMTVRADLVQDGAVVSSKEFRHFSPSTSPDTCRVMNRIARPIGKDAAKWAQSELQAHARPREVKTPDRSREMRSIGAALAPAPGVETIAIQLHSVDTSETDPTAALIAHLQDGLIARHFAVRPVDEADALLVVRHDSNGGRATTVDLALVERATGRVLWTGRSINGQLSVAGVTLAADAALRPLPARSGKR